MQARIEKMKRAHTANLHGVGADFAVAAGLQQSARFK